MHLNWQLRFLIIHCFLQKLCFSPWRDFAYGWILSGLTVFMTLEWCYLRAKFIVTAPSRISSMNLRSRLIVNPGCAWIGSLASVTVRRRLEVAVIGFLFWLLILQEMLLCFWLAAPVLTSLYYPVITTFCCDLITFLFGLWLLESLAFWVENEYSNSIRVNIQYSAFQIRWLPQAKENPVFAVDLDLSHMRTFFLFLKFISTLAQFSMWMIIKVIVCRRINWIKL